MGIPLVSNKFKKEESQLKALLNEYSDIIDRNSFLIKDKIDEVKKEFETLFNFVVVGKVKAGKSSFLNALLGIKEGEEDIFEVGPGPQTSKITIVRKGEGNIETKGDIVTIYKDLDSLEGIEIIDTPGTDTIMEKHEKITRDFLENSNLIMFVFDSKNIYTKSDWDLVEEIIKNLNKDVIFILSQKDRASQEEIEMAKKELMNRCNKIDLKDPKIFLTSAKLEIESKADSGFQQVRDYIFNEIGSHDKKRMKLKTIIGKIRFSVDQNSNILNEKIDELEVLERYYETLNAFLGENHSFFNIRFDSINDAIKNYYLNKLTDLKDSILNFYKTQKKVKENIEYEISQFKKEVSKTLNDRITREILNITDEEKSRINRFFDKKEVVDRLGIDPFLREKLKLDVDKEFIIFSNDLEKEINKILDRTFKTVTFKNKNLLNRLYISRSVQKRLDNEISNQMKALENTLKSNVESFLNSLQVKMQTSMFENYEAFKKEINKLEHFKDLKERIDGYSRQLEDIESSLNSKSF
jgi:GTPase SAR1 family protein